MARIPINQLVMHKLLINQALLLPGPRGDAGLGTFFDGIARHTPEGFDFTRTAAEAGFKEAVRERDEPFGDFGLSRRHGRAREGPDHELADAVRARRWCASSPTQGHEVFAA